MHPENPNPVAPERHAAILVNNRTQAETVVRGGEPQTTNNRMELRAAVEALAALEPGAVVTMIGDLEYVLKGMTVWMPAWKARNWRTTKGKPVLNVDCGRPWKQRRRNMLRCGGPG